MDGLVFDTGVLIAADRNERRAWAWKKEALERSRVPVVPAPVVVQAWRGKSNANMARFLAGCRIRPLDKDQAARAGELCGLTRTSDVVDAVVVATAAGGNVVVTSDPSDLKLLAGAVRGVRIVEL